MNHLTEADIVLYLNDELPPDKREEAENHLAGCDVCLSKLADACSLEERMEASQPPILDRRILEKAKKLPDGSKKSPVISFIGTRVAAAAVAVIVFGIILFYALGNFWDPPQRYRSQDDSLLVVPAQPEDGATIDSMTPVFAWMSVENAASYRLKLFRETGVPLWEGTTVDTAKTLPDDVLMESGNKYLWRIEVIMPDGRTLRSELRAFYY